MTERHAVKARVVQGRHVWTAERMVDRRADPWAHAEILALKKAGPRARGALVVSTLEPCVMCAGAMQQAHVGSVLWETHDRTSGAWTMGLVPPGVRGQGSPVTRAEWQSPPEWVAWQRAHPGAPCPRADWWWWDFGATHTWPMSKSLWDRMVQRFGRVRPSRWRREGDRVVRLATLYTNPMGFNWAVRAYGFAMGSRRWPWHRMVSQWLQQEVHG